MDYRIVKVGDFFYMEEREFSIRGTFGFWMRSDSPHLTSEDAEKYINEVRISRRSAGWGGEGKTVIKEFIGLPY